MASSECRGHGLRYGVGTLDNGGVLEGLLWVENIADMVLKKVTEPCAFVRGDECGCGVVYCGWLVPGTVLSGVE